jgi:membrane fusion protein, copper/silver efflux system
MNSRLLTLGLVGFVTLGVPGPDGDDVSAGKFGPLLQPTIGLRVAEVTRGRRNSEITVGATVICDEGEVAGVRATVSGTVEHLRVRATQSAVRQGEALAHIYVRDWFAPQAAYLAVRDLECPGAADLVEGAGRRLRRVGMPEELIRVLERTGIPQSHVTLTAPISGVVTDLAAHEGMKVTSGSVLFRIRGGGLSKVWVNAELPESVGQEVRAGDTVTARTATLPDAVFSGTVATVLPSGQHARRATIASVALANPRMELLPGMLVTLRFASAAGADVLLVPSEAVIAMGDRRLVAVFESDGRVRPVSVELGSQGGGQTEIHTGLTLGQKVIVFDT